MSLSDLNSSSHFFTHSLPPLLAGSLPPSPRAAATHTHPHTLTLDTHAAHGHILAHTLHTQTCTHYATHTQTRAHYKYTHTYTHSCGWCSSLFLLLFSFPILSLSLLDCISYFWLWLSSLALWGHHSVSLSVTLITKG